MASKESCTYKEGRLPVCGPLAVGTIPMQSASTPAFEKEEALVKGTLFPGLDLPFMDYVAPGPLEETPLTELMALEFVCQELALYLDTHSDDQEAFQTWKCFTELVEEGRRRYVERFGPIARRDTAASDSWVWATESWPWDYMGRVGEG